MNDQSLKVIQKMDSVVTEFISQKNLEGLQKMYVLGESITNLRNLLDDKFMGPIMGLQNTSLGFKTDKAENGYPVSVVKDCTIEALLTGVQPYGNQFNIIAGNFYVTKEGFKYLLDNYPKLDWMITPGIPEKKSEKEGGIRMSIQWSTGGQTKTKDIDFVVKVNKFMGSDAIVGKAERKARAWLYNNITGSELVDGDVESHDAELVKPIPIEKLDKAKDVDHETERITKFIDKAESESDLDNLKEYINTEEQQSLFDQKLNEIKAK